MERREPDLGERWPSRLVATAAEGRPKSETGGNYDECIGAKKHLVTGVSLHIGSPKRSNSFPTG
jgi:hypothetical protein